jgi:GxxExxY protein
MAVTRSGAAPNDLTQSIIGGAIEVHSAIGPGLLDRAYAACLDHEIRSRGLAVRRKCAVAAGLQGLRLSSAFLADMIVEDCVIVELKALEA